jgi:hydrophobic/amphiphilic exporter-1 (mainly G- bacteria), HAE1 family
VKSLVNFVIRNKLAVWLLTFIVIFMGIYSGSKMKMESIPDVSVPYLIVNTVYPGATPEQVMEEVSMPIEKAVESLEGVSAVYSNSYSSMSTIQIEYDYEQDLDIAKREIENALETITLPEDTEEPMITKISMNMMPVLVLSISSTEEDIVELTSTVEDILVPKIEQIEGVASATTTGQHIEEVELTFDEEKLAQYDLTKDDVKDIIKATDLDVSLGLFEFEDGEQAVRIDGKFTTAEDLKEMLIPVTPTETQPLPFVKLRDIATIEVVGKVESISRTNGEDSITVQIVKGQEANTVEVVNAVKDLMKDYEKKLDGLEVDYTFDQGEPIENSVSQMVSKALFGGGIAVLIILLFLRDVRSTIISIISIPVSILTALLILDYLDMTLNIMTLGAITISIGRVIDDSIVVVENIYRRLHLKGEQLRGRALIREATIEMFKPILSSTLVTVAVFAPLLFVGGMIGELFVPFALTMALALGASLLVAISIVPSLSHSLFKKQLYNENVREKKVKKPSRLAEIYKKALHWTLKHKVITSIVAIAALVGSLMLTPLVGFSFLGNDEQKVMYITYTPKPGDTEEQTLKNVTEVEEKMLSLDDVTAVQFSVTDNTSVEAAMMGGSGSLMFVVFDEEMNNFPEVKKEVEDYLENLNHSGEWKSQNFMTGIASNELSYYVYSEDLDDLEAATKEIEAVMAESKYLEDVSSSFDEAYEEYSIRVEQETLLQYGLTAGQILMMLNPVRSEEVLTTVEKDGDDLNVIIKHDKQMPQTFDEMLDQMIPTPTGDAVRLGDIVTIEKGSVPSHLDRSKGRYYATVSGTILDEDVSKAALDVDDKLSDIELPKGVELDNAGVTADMEEAFTQLGIAMIAAVLIVYFILVVTFGEGLAPFTILFSLPFTVIGAIIGLWIAGETISVMVLMGMLMLIGIVVTNAIVLVDRIIRMERNGMSMREAILEAGSTRLRPILMTAIATVGALIPLLFEATGTTGTFMSKSLGVTVIGGLVSSTILTLFIVPIVYETLSKLFKKNRKEIVED